MMYEITYRKGDFQASKKIHGHALERTLGFFRAAGYEIVNDGRTPAAPAPAEQAPAPAPAAPAAEQAGYVGHGKVVHRIIAGHAKCGASWRKGHSFHTTRKVHLTSEAVTCAACNR